MDIILQQGHAFKGFLAKTIWQKEKKIARKKIIADKNNQVKKRFFLEKVIEQTNYWANQIIRPKKITRKSYGQKKIIGWEKILVHQNYRAEKILSKKK